MGKSVAVLVVAAALVAALVMTLPQTNGSYGQRAQTALFGQIEAVKSLFVVPIPPPRTLSLTAQQRRDRTLIEAIHRRSYEEVRAALKAGASPNARGYWPSKGGWSPGDLQNGPSALMLAVLADPPAGPLRIVPLLLERGARVNARDTGGYTALSVAELYDRRHAARLLRRHGAARS